MKRILILGASGMLGHKALQIFAQHCEVAGTVRRPVSALNRLLGRSIKIFEGVDAWNLDTVRATVKSFRPDAILNCVGVIKQLDEAKQSKPSIYLNALFPHLLSELAHEAGARLIHISTDCVFDGCKGDYTEADPPSATDLYGRSKFLGEVGTANSLSLRTSIIGHELDSALSLVDWFLSQNGKRVSGYAKAIYTGLPTVTFCRELWRVLERFPTLSGIYQVSSEKIAKYELLMKIRQRYAIDVEIVPSSSPVIDRSLDSTAYRDATGFQPAPWDMMLDEMHDDYVHMYQPIRRGR